MVQLMRSDSDNNHFKKVKLESQQQDDHQLHSLPNKRPKFDFNSDSPKCDSGDDSGPISYNPLDEPSPLGLRLKKSPSLLDLIQMKLSQNYDSKKKDHKGSASASASSAASAADNKLKASNFPATVLKIGTWEYKSRYEGDLVAKCYFAKHKLVWEVLDGCLKNKIEIPWSDIMALKANYPEDAPGTLEVILARRPLFFREINPQPRKHTLWQSTSDFTGGQASIHRRHFVQCPQGLLGRHFEKLIQCDPRLNFLSQQPDFVLDSPYFETGTAIHDHIELSGGLDRKSEGKAGIFGLHDVESGSGSGSGIQSSSSRSEQNLMGKAVENNFQEITSPSSGMNPHAIKGFRSRGPESDKFLSNLSQIKLPGLHPSMSMDDLVNHIGHCISEQMGPENSSFANDRSVLEEFTQYLFNDSQFPPVSDEQNVMSRVNSLYCLLQKDPSAPEEKQVQNGNNVFDAAEDTKVDEGNSAERKSKMFDLGIQQDDDDDASGSQQQENGLSRKDSAGDLLLNLPRIASLPHFLFPMSEDSGSHVR